VRTDWSNGTSLPVAKCERIIRASINGCDRGGTGTLESWYFKRVSYYIRLRL
jgi:hypothetical protein